MRDYVILVEQIKHKKESSEAWTIVAIAYIKFTFV
jgi:hypothetical protein